MKQVWVLTTDRVRANAARACHEAQEGAIVTIGPPTRTLDQNSAMWPILEAFARDLQWPVNGRMTHMTADEWKDVLTAAFRREQPRMAPGMDGGVVMLGQRTSKFNKREMSDFLEFLHATAVDRGVVVYPEEVEHA